MPHIKSIYLIVNRILFFVVFCWTLVSCSSYKISKVPQIKPVQLSEKEQLDYDHDFIEATKFKLFGNLADAASQLTRCTEVNPYDAAAYYQLAEIYSAINDLPNALKNARLAARYEDGNIWYKMQLANLYIVDKKIDSAIVVYGQIAEIQPDNTDLRYNLALLYVENDQYKKALKELKKVERTYGFTEELAIAQYHVYTKKRDNKAIEAVLLKGVEKFPDEFRFYGLLAELYSSVGKEQKAQQYYEKLLEVDPDNALGYISMIEFYKDYGNDERALEEMHRMYNAKTIDPDLKVELYIALSSDTVFVNKHFQKLDEMMKHLFEKHPENIRVRMINADRNLRHRKFEAAKDDLLFITDRVQTNAYLWERLFYLLSLLQDNETLYESTGRALKYFEDNFLFNFFRGMAASTLEKHDDVIEFCSKALECMKKEKEPDSEIELHSYVLLGEAYNERKMYDKSDEIFDKAIKKSPNNPLILNNYSYYLSLREEKLDLAEKYIKRCLAAEPNSSTYLDTYGWVLYKQGRIQEAIVMVEKAMKNGGGDNPEIVEHMCELLVVSGQLDEAYHICKYAVELTNSGQTSEQKIKSIQEKKKEQDVE